MTQNNKHDPLADQLYQEAMSERPRFSPDLHQRLVADIRAERSSADPRRIFPPPRWLAAAAALVIISLPVFWLALSPSTKTSTKEQYVMDSPPAPQIPSLLPTPPLPQFAVDFDGILHAQLWPPQITLAVPRLQSSPAPSDAATDQADSPAPVASAALPGSPQWLFSMLKSPTLGAQGVLTNLIPPDLRAIADQAATQR